MSSSRPCHPTLFQRHCMAHSIDKVSLNKGHKGALCLVIREMSGLEIENTAVGIRHADHVAPSVRKSWH
jgi:hypothetical protein